MKSLFADPLLETLEHARIGMNMTREAGAQAIGVLESLYADRDLPACIRPLVRDILAKWHAGNNLMEKA